MSKENVTLSKKAQESRMRMNKVSLAILNAIDACIQDDENITYVEVNSVLLRMASENNSELLKDEWSS